MSSRMRVMRAFCLAFVATFAWATAAASQESFVAGWDFSQYIGAGAASTDCDTLSTSLPANYSDFDPTFGAGAESADFGTMFNDGTNGSDMTNGSFIPYLPTSGVVSENETQPQNGVPFGDLTFNALGIQDAEFPGRCAMHQDVSMISVQAHKVVFQADLSTLESPPTGTDWTLRFGGKTEMSGTAAVEIEFAEGASVTDEDYSSVTTVMLSASEQLFAVPLGSSAGDSVFVRLKFPTPGGPGQSPIVDNLGITVTVPEPGVVGSAAALLTLAGLSWKRRQPLKR